ncbi:hypothetical protein EG329_006312 [Mollisiaceae sp. DMI_Dod_QoI]|nr:hypothetical protein EG329_006312 [Helotiales sp. DMI_Dod_QoI]
MAEEWGLSLIREAETSSNDIHTVDPVVDIVLVHGLNGHPYKTWTVVNSGVFWPRDLLPRGLPNCRVFTYGYQASLTEFLVSPNIIISSSRGLLETLAQQRGHDQNDNRKLIFVAHSLGGLIVKQALLLASNSLHDGYHEILKATAGIVFMGTPHCGNSDDITRVLQYCASIGTEKEITIAGSHSFAELSAQLGAAHKEFQEFYTRELPQFQIVSFLEELPIPGFGLVVNRRSATFSSATFLPVYANHETICKFTETSESNYQRVLGELKKFAYKELDNRSALIFEQQEHLRLLEVDNGSDLITRAAPDTCEWIFRNKQFTSWLKSGNSSVFWIQGMAGSGKSTLVKYITQQLKDSTVASFYFHTSQGAAETTPSALLQSLIFQIQSQVPGSMSEMAPCLLQQRDCYTKLDDSYGRERLWMSKNLNGLFEKTLKKVSKTHRICFFIDALDECPAENSSDILSLLSSINSIVLERSIKLCITSRPHQYMEATYRSWHRKIVLEDENTGDIQRFVNLGITRLPQFLKWKNGEAIVAELVDKILERARGVFIWPKAALDLLNHHKDPIELAKSALFDISSDLEDLYSTILDRLIHDENGSISQAEELLRWVCFARRPLSVEEMSHVLGIDQSLQNVCGDKLGGGIMSKATSAAVYEHRLRARCWGLLEVREPGSKVQFIHRSVREFLVNKLSAERSSKKDPKRHFVQRANIHLAEICLSYISRHADMSLTDRDSVEIEPDAFLDYATDYWHEHARLADQPDISHTVLLKALCWPSTKVLGHWAYLHQKKIGDDAVSDYCGWSALHVAAAFGVLNLALAIRDVEGSNLVLWGLRDTVGRTPLALAAEKGHLSLVKLLIEVGADIETRDYRHRLSPLARAAFYGHSEVVKLLLNHGADSDDNVGGDTALSVAAARGHVEVLEALLNWRADPNLPGKHFGRTPLQISAGNGNIAIVSLLLSRGADPTGINPFTKKTPLYYATAGGHQNVVRLLLDSGGGAKQSCLGPIPNSQVSWADRVACSFLRALEGTPLSHPVTSTPSKTTTSASSGSGFTTSQTNHNSNSVSKKRLRDIAEDVAGGGMGGSGNDPNKQPTLDQTPSSALNGPCLRLACPYYKYDPGRYGSQRLCRGPTGWPSVNRLKEHLYKSHFVEVCKRCCGPFKDRQALDTHSKAVIPCSVKLERDYGDGFDDDQCRSLKSRTHRRECKGDELEYWKGVYKILFPGKGMDPTLNPCYDTETVSKKSYDESCARAREDPLLRTQIFQVINDPKQVDPVQAILALINTHQAVSVSPITHGNNGASATMIDTPPLVSSGGSSMYQPPQRSGESFDISPYLQVSASWLPQQSHSYSDSGFFSSSSTKTEADVFTLPPQVTEAADFENLVQSQSIRASSPSLMAATSTSAEDFDIDELVASWDEEHS